MLRYERQEWRRLDERKRRVGSQKFKFWRLKKYSFFGGEKECLWRFFFVSRKSV